MAAIGKIRSWGPWLVGIIGLALFGFIATDFTRSCETSSNQARQQVGEVMGNRISIQDYQSNVEEYKLIYKVLQDGYRQVGREIGEPEEDVLRDNVWNSYIQYAIIEEEASKLGLGVTNAEMEEVLRNPSHPALNSLPLLPVFMDQQTGRFDYNNVNQYQAMLQQYAPGEVDEFNRYWAVVEKLLRQQLLISKYYGLLQACMLTNGASAEAAFKGRTVESDIVLASLAYSSINDNDITISDQDLTAKYNEQREQYRWNNETRDIKYVVSRIVPSQADIDAMNLAMANAAQQLRSDSMPLADILSSCRSLIPYQNDMPFNEAGLKAISPALFAAIDSLPNGAVTAPVAYTTHSDGREYTMRAVAKLVRKYQATDSIAYQLVAVPGNSIEDASTRADSILAVLSGGQPFDSLAANLGQADNAAKQWFCANQYQGQDNISPIYISLFNAVHNATLNQPAKLELTDRVFVYQAVERKAPVTLYDVAIVSNELKFSNDTYNQTYNKFSQYLSACQNAQDFETKAGENGYMVQAQNNLESTAHVIGDVNPYTRQATLPNTREAVKWAYNDASEGSISRIFDNNASLGLLVAVCVTKVHPAGYLDQSSVEDQLRAEVMKDKKASKLIDQLAGAKTVAEAQAKGAVIDTIQHITFSAPTNIKGYREAGISGAVAGTELGQNVSRVIKGNNGIYLFSVIDRHLTDSTAFATIQRQEEQRLINAATSLLQKSPYGRPYTDVLDVLIQKANVQDLRYQF
jgi:peptidyl-prolyl cis-trans isomerase D